MSSHGFRLLVLALGAIALTACVEPAPAVAEASSVVPNLGIDLGSSARVRRVTGLAGEGEGYGRTEPNPTRMPGINHGSMPGMEMNRGSMPSKDHASTRNMQMDRGSMPGMSHGSMEGRQ